ncbi:STAS-like domain-containing protein [Acinetobacter pittii]|uniref:STAS-like domain-containing protein n=1 Tax=Acinetobacter pittii TaxID=48296 RepID=UPI0020307FAD|nr:STAS-like domain-containing protein [Acinetobacter pittii]MCM1961990.1 STAS-like domain-containing protein [Acinetobacter pittii]MCM1978101.1 STAS-like domain-containing protein [Acinetobacter pittii]
MNLSVAREFYRRPSGRYRIHGTYTGEAFREDILLPRLKSLKEGEKFIIDFSGVSMNGSSFLEEAFGGLVRDHNYTYSDLRNILVLEFPRRPSLADMVWKYILDAEKVKMH